MYNRIIRIKYYDYEVFYILYFTHWAPHLLRMFLKISTIIFVETESQLWSLSYSNERREKENMSSFESQMWAKWNDDESEYNDLQGNIVENDYKGKEVITDGETEKLSVTDMVAERYNSQAKYTKCY